MALRHGVWALYDGSLEKEDQDMADRVAAHRAARNPAKAFGSPNLGSLGNEGCFGDGDV